VRARLQRPGVLAARQRHSDDAVHDPLVVCRAPVGSASANAYALDYPLHHLLSSQSASLSKTAVALTRRLSAKFEMILR